MILAFISITGIKKSSTANIIMVSIQLLGLFILIAVGLLETGIIKDGAIDSNDYFALSTDPKFNQLLRSDAEKLHEKNWETDDYFYRNVL